MYSRKWKKAGRILAGLMALVLVFTSLSFSSVYAEETGTSTDTVEPGSVGDRTWNFRAATAEDVITIESAKGEYKGLVVDATAGKLAVREGNWAQFNAGTIIKVPVDGSCEITVENYDVNYKVNGTAATAATETFTYTGEAGYVEVVATANSYIGSIALKHTGNTTETDTVEPGSVGDRTWNFRAATAEDVIQIQAAVGKYKGLIIDATEGKLAVREGNWAQFNAGTIIKVPVDGSCEITVENYDVNYKVNGTAATAATETFTYTGEAGYVEVVATANSYIGSIALKHVAAPEEPVIDTSKVDVWDFGAEELDSTKYNNNITVDVANEFYGSSVTPGSTGVCVPSFTAKDGAGEDAVKFVTDKTNNRYRTTNTAISRYDEKSKTGDDGHTYTGYIYSNNSSVDTTRLEFYLYEGDTLTCMLGSNSNAATYILRDPSGADYATFEFQNQSGLETAVFHAAETGWYQLYCSNEKLVCARIIREHAPLLAVSGSITAPENIPEGYGIIFTNTSTGKETVAEVKNNTYSSMLYGGYTYDVSLKNANGFVIKTGMTLELADTDATHNLVIETVDQTVISGNVTGLSAEALNKVEFEFAVPEGYVYVPELTIDRATGKYSLIVESGVEYKVEAKNVNDYALSTTTVSAKADTTADIVFTKKPTYEVTLDITGVKDTSNAVATFKNINEEGYVYTFSVADKMELRDGSYSVKVTGLGNYAVTQGVTANVNVNGAAASTKVPFEEISSWNFSVLNGTNDVETIDGEKYYAGLALTGSVQENKTYLLANADSTITVPSLAKGDKVTIKYCYSAAFSAGDISVDEKSGSTSKIDSAELVIAKDGDLTIEAVKGSNASQTYFCAIEVLRAADVVAYTDTLYVGADKEFTTINDALAYVAKMARTADQNVTIMIDPGNYEEMLVIDLPNITLKNASSAPSIELKNKGVDIDKNAVRVTWYYGHGYTYYSMDSDCKYNADLLAANKSNGYASFKNPGSGTTNGSYWNATVVISADNFSAEGIIFENSFNQYVSAKSVEDVIEAQSGAKEGTVARADMKTVGDTTVQDKAYVERAAALAIYNNVKEVSFDNCKFIGRQDTLYGGTGVTAAFYDCSIYGGTDYIFGGMTAVFAKCDLVFNTSENGNDVGYITAPQQSSGRGYLMYNCTVTSTTPGVDSASEYTSKAGYFGRPWAANTGEAVFYDTVIEATDSHWYDDSASLIKPAGWLSTLSGESALCVEYGTYEMAKDVDNSTSRAAWAGVLETPTLSDGTAISVEAFLGDWDAFAGKDMEIVMPTNKVDNKPAEEPSEPSATTEFTLDTTADLTAFAAGAKADGDSEKAGTENYFTLLYSAKTKVDSSSKTFDDGYAATQRVNFGGVATTEKNAIKFTTNSAATVKVWWVEGGEDNRQLTLLNSAGTEVDGTNETLAKNATCISTLKVSEAGTYYLGSKINNNYIFKVVVTEEASTEPIVNELDTTNDLTAFAQGAKADGDSEKAGTNDFFTLIYSAKTKVDSSSKTFEDGYSATQRVNFGGTVSTEKNAIKFTTGSAATVKVWWAEGGDDNRQLSIIDSTGTEAAGTDVTLAKNATCISELALSEAGTYYLGSKIGNNYIFKVVVTENNGSVKPPRADWSTVAAPEITNIALNASDSGKVDVTVKALVGYDGADKITVTMTDASGAAVASASSSAEKSEHTVSLTPDASGTYTFSVKAIREGETDKEGTTAKEFAFTLPLAAPTMKSATNRGNGAIEVKWNAVKEAEGYVLTVDGTDISIKTEELSALVKGLTVGTEYTFRVAAVRGEDVSESASIKATAIAEAETEWAFAAFGQGVDTKNNGYEGNANDGSVRVYSNNGKGKIVPGSTDGLAFYYTEIDPETTNFTLTATAKVNNWKLSNGQEGFGLMAADAVGTNGDSSVFWNNSYMASVTKVEYCWDGEKVSDAGDKITMKLGVGSQEKKGVELENITPALTLVDMSVFSSHMDTLETSCAAKGSGTYNIVGNYGGVDGSGVEPTGTVENSITEFTLTIQKNNTGYFVSYTDLEGNTTTNKYYGTDILNYVDKDSVYVGFYASRNADITFEDITFTTIPAKDDAPAEERPVSYVTPSYQIVSGTVANSSEYNLAFVGNADGTLVITDCLGQEVVKNTEVKANTKVEKLVKLHYGDNTYNVSFTPDADYRPSEFEKLSSYDAVSFKFTVSYKAYGEEGDALYVTPDGSASGNGTKENPLDIYTAVKYVQAGQTIVIGEGTYNLSRTVKIERGINGTADKMIYMVADPKAKTRPVFDFGGKCAGMILAGNYWYFKGFDVTRSADAQKGIQVSGDHNTLDQINTYKNGNTGIQVSRYLTTDEYADWPSYNLILNCTSYENADKGYEDADGFAAKLTVGDGNVFDGCIAHHNADDGWDLFAKVQSGEIGKVIIRNCVAYKNGYVLDEKGNEVNAGNGNGFKMGGDSMSGYHELHNSISFFNKAKGIDSNSCPDIQVYNSISFNNESYNVAFYTNSALNTDYKADGVISYRTEYKDQTENIKPKGTQDQTKIYGSTNYYWDVASQTSVNKDGKTVSADWFESLEFKGIDRNEDGTINTHGFLILTDKAQTGESIGGTGSDSDIEIGTETDGTIEGTDTENLAEETVEELVSIIDTLPENGTVTVEMNGATIIPEEALMAAEGRNINLVFNMGNYSWTINGNDINGTGLADTNLEVIMDADQVPAKIITETVGNMPVQQISLVHNGEFGFKAVLSIYVGKEYAGQYANLHYYNAGGLSFCSASLVSADGMASFVFTHASDYVIALGRDMTPAGGKEDNPPQDNPSQGNNSQENNSQGNNSQGNNSQQSSQSETAASVTVTNVPTTSASADTGDNAPIAEAVLLLFAAFVVLAAYAKKRRA